MAQPQLSPSAADAVNSNFGHEAMLAKLLKIAAEAEQTVAEQAKRIAELESLLYTDELTGLANRRGLNDAIGRALSSAQRYNETGGLVYMDLDGFKAVNDHYGHEAGDKVLKAIASTITSHIRATDTAARLGGDEFAVLFTKGDPGALRAKAERLRIILLNTYVDFDGVRIAIRTSLGFAQYKPGMTRDVLVRNADTAMYADKRLRKAKAYLTEIPPSKVSNAP
ncbi:MAG TPA: GGDEF domain-containing protein [Alphaproteobacteria bacterium]|nr:GGDEF domain-containing protein [Alphaproteobacteria bacterium]HAJ48234.1 GGDEF domain-containing protein [Alphaproteobacteria bacterium]